MRCRCYKIPKCAPPKLYYDIIKYTITVTILYDHRGLSNTNVCLRHRDVGMKGPRDTRSRNRVKTIRFRV